MLEHKDFTTNNFSKLLEKINSPSLLTKIVENAVEVVEKEKITIFEKIKKSRKNKKENKIT